MVSAPSLVISHVVSCCTLKRSSHLFNLRSDFTADEFNIQGCERLAHRQLTITLQSRHYEEIITDHLTPHAIAGYPRKFLHRS